MVPAIRVTNVSADEFEVQIGDEKLVLHHADFPWFRDAPIEELRNVEMISIDHMRWPHLDIDLHVDSVRFPEKFPLISQQ